VQVRVRPGHHARLLDISTHGARIETTCRVVPNTSIELRIDAGNGPYVARAVVVRSAITRLDHALAVYESAVRFQLPLPGVIVTPFEAVDTASPCLQE
jgi:hypothetical protein